MIITDLDNTLLNSDKKISDYTKFVLQKCADKGIYVVFASARPILAITKYMTENFPDFIISNNGATVNKQGEVIFNSIIDRNTVEKVLIELISEKDIKAVSMQTPTIQYTNDPDYMIWGEEWGGVFHEFDVLPTDEYTKISTQTSNIELLNTIISKYPELHLYANSTDTWQQITNRTTSKLNAVAFIANSLGFSLSQVVSFGDDFNDVEMLKGCGVGVAVKNAIPNVKEKANHICDSNDEDGVAHWIDEYLIQERKI